MAKDESLKAITRTAKDVEAVAKKATLAAIEAAKEQVGRLEHDVANARTQMNNAIDDKVKAERKRDDATQENEGNKAKFERILQERNNLSSETVSLGSELKVANDKIAQVTDQIKEARATAKSATNALENAEETSKKEIEDLQSDIVMRDENIETYTGQMKEMTVQIVALKSDNDTLNAAATKLQAELAETNKGESAKGDLASSVKKETKDDSGDLNISGNSGKEAKG